LELGLAEPVVVARERRLEGKNDLARAGFLFLLDAYH
jgi:hypothetical protein